MFFIDHIPSIIGAASSPIIIIFSFSSFSAFSLASAAAAPIAQQAQQQQQRTMRRIIIKMTTMTIIRTVVELLSSQNLIPLSSRARRFSGDPKEKACSY